MAQLPEPIDQLKDTPLRFLETEQFQEMLSTYQKLKPLETEHPRKFKNQMNTYDFGDIYPLLDDYLQTHDLSIGEIQGHSPGYASGTCAKIQNTQPSGTGTAVIPQLLLRYTAEIFGFRTGNQHPRSH